MPAHLQDGGGLPGLEQRWNMPTAQAEALSPVPTCHQGILLLVPISEGIEKFLHRMTSGTKAMTPGTGWLWSFIFCSMLCSGVLMFTIISAGQCWPRLPKDEVWVAVSGGRAVAAALARASVQSCVDLAVTAQGLPSNLPPTPDKLQTGCRSSSRSTP